MWKTCQHEWLINIGTHATLLKVNSIQICGCVNSVPNVLAITHPFSGGFPLRCSDSRGQTNSCCCCYFLSLGTTLMLQSQSLPSPSPSPSPPSGEDGDSLSRGRSRWDRVALHFLKRGRIFRYAGRNPYLCSHHPGLGHMTAET